MEKGTGDISGIYGGTLVNEETIKDIKVQFYSYNDINYANWSKGEYSYSYQNTNGKLNLDELNTLLDK